MEGFTVDFTDVKKTLDSLSNRMQPKLTFGLYHVEDINQIVQDSLWEQGISLDDVDYMLITHNTKLFHNVENEDLSDWDIPSAEAQRVIPDDYDIERLINRADDNRWYRANVNGKDVVVGVAYH